MQNTGHVDFIRFKSLQSDISNAYMSKYYLRGLFKVALSQASSRKTI